jgi:DNA-binding CsgD family transcriptional regulator
MAVAWLSGPLLQLERMKQGRVMPAPESSSQKSDLTANDDGVKSWRPVLGFIVADTSLKPLFANSEAIAILTYPGPPPQSIFDMFHKKLRPGFSNGSSSRTKQNGANPIFAFQSGRRTYFCRTLLLNGDSKGSTGSARLLMLERKMSGTPALFQLSRQFQLTQREHQAVSLLLQGLSNKEMAKKMGISEHTVKVYLRMATVRMGVSGRAAIVTKIVDVLWSSVNSE